jgi:hypothetical protein
VLQALTGHAPNRPAIDGAKLAVELGLFQQAVDILLPRVGQIDEGAMVTLALALDGLGRSNEALELLESHCRKSSGDALGTLGGRVKRRWLAERSAADLERARSLYKQGLAQALAENDHHQAHYHLINIAFLDLLSAPAGASVPGHVAANARQAIVHCEQVEQDKWSRATQGEAYLMLRDWENAKVFYLAAIGVTSSLRDLNSMYSQAIRVALRAGGEREGRMIQEIFGVAVPS